MDCWVCDGNILLLCTHTRLEWMFILLFKKGPCCHIDERSREEEEQFHNKLSVLIGSEEKLLLVFTKSIHFTHSSHWGLNKMTTIPVCGEVGAQALSHGCCHCTEGHGANTEPLSFYWPSLRKTRESLRMGSQWSVCLSVCLPWFYPIAHIFGARCKFPQLVLSFLNYRKSSTPHNMFTKVFTWDTNSLKKIKVITNKKKHNCILQSVFTNSKARLQIDRWSLI